MQRGGSSALNTGVTLDKRLSLISCEATYQDCQEREKPTRYINVQLVLKPFHLRRGFLWIASLVQFKGKGQA